MNELIRLSKAILSYDSAPENQMGPIDLVIHSNEMMGLIGESGSGKSTLGYAILDALRWKKAKLVSGEIIRSIPVHQTAFIPQDTLSSLDPLFSIGDQLREFSNNEKEILAALEKVHLKLKNFSLKSYPHELSGGMRQRVMIAMALLRRAKLIVADEPTSALDAHLREEVMKLLKDLQQKEGIGIILITHHLPLAIGFCDQVVILEKGKVVETGLAEDVFKNPKHLYTQTLMDAIPKLNFS